MKSKYLRKFWLIIVIIGIFIQGCNRILINEGNNINQEEKVISLFAIPVQKIYYGITGSELETPLELKITDINGKTHENLNSKVSFTNDFDNFQAEFVGNNKVPIDAQGKASINIKLGDKQGVYRIRAKIMNELKSIDAVFTIFTEGVVSKIDLSPIEANNVDDPILFNVTSTDWKGNAVKNSKVIAYFNDELEVFTPTSTEGSLNKFNVYTKNAGTRDLIVTDDIGGFTIGKEIKIKPGNITKLEIQQTENPRYNKPFNQTKINVIAKDANGNFVPNAEITWGASDGSIKPVDPIEGFSASARITFGELSKVNIKASFGEIIATSMANAPGVYFNTKGNKTFAFIGDTFKIKLDVFPPKGGGVLRGFTSTLKYNAEACKYLSIQQSNNSIPVSDTSSDDGVILISVPDTELELPEEQDNITIGELVFVCLNESPACIKILDGNIVLQHSPPVTYTLNPGLEYCRSQKADSSKNICLNFCLVIQPGKKTYEQLKAVARSQVSRASELFNGNLDTCCPQITFDTCFNEITWATYRPIITGGGVPNGLDTAIYTEGGRSTLSNDSNKDIVKISQEVKNLIKLCRKDSCLSIYIVPSANYKSGTTWRRTLGTTLSPNDFPETFTNEAGTGPSIILPQNQPDNNSLIHELGHMLIDLPRNTNGGIEHVRNRNRIMNGSGHIGTKFTKEECSRIWDNIGKFNGSCD